ncbi:alpha/beta fold hydrolase [Flavilitoribacter nigricans]|uniref:Alpha/beta hydrolase n=1 Tax=Flavilitoribacter nigricans (strain ATCC 23147 / DSM 23189 / NBRC 102662 / NCIMB 1420 / SS-2) TaxID=1122177 RepID=A0A2D0N6E1_FLAN2|nr:alpha/beta hydrolase [Flavilitoribacter nigricans]PHN04027.1 alpha/beta hydrolase [Flavilitoribacter nigricans DSM 23189 = NBRC 102662]
MNYEIIQEKQFKYIETQGGEETLLLLHGLFGALSNFEGILDHFGNSYNVVVPILPIFELPLRKVSVTGLVDYVADFIEYKGYDKINILGNSLGGHISLLYVLNHPHKVKTIILTGSSGLFESAMGTSFPKRGDYEFMKKKVQGTFYDPKIASKELVDEVFDIVNDRNKAIRIIATAKSAVRHNLGDKLHRITVPTLLVWGKEDQVTPAFVGEKFNELIENSELILLPECGHAPMMEHPEIFNQHLESFLQSVGAETLGH